MMSSAHKATPTEENCLARHHEAVCAVRGYIHANTNAASHVHHGPSHWARVEAHALVISQSLGISPLVPALFALVHDSQRINDNADPWHGSRAARFVREHRTHLFSFLSESDWMILQEACEKHSDGLVSENPILQACWDADRLDLGRVGIKPAPAYMGSAFAKRPEVIKFAWEQTNPPNSSRAMCDATSP